MLGKGCCSQAVQGGSPGGWSRTVAQEQTVGAVLNVEVGVSVLLLLSWSLSGSSSWKWLAARPSELLNLQCALLRDLFSAVDLVTSSVSSST